MPTAQLLLRGPFIRPQLDAVIGLTRRHCCGCAHGPSSQPNRKVHQIPRRHHSTTSPSASPTSSPPQYPNKASEIIIPPPPQPQTKRLPDLQPSERTIDQVETQTQAQPQSQFEAQTRPEPHAQTQTQEAKPQPKKSDPIPGPNIVAPLPFWQRLGPLTRAGQAYARAQRTRPWATQVASVLVIYLCADFGAQSMGAASRAGQEIEDEEGEGAGEEGKSSSSGKGGHDWARTARSLIIGGTAAIPGYLWFSYLSQNFNYPSRVLSIAVKVGINQLLFTPIFNVYFFGSQALLSGDSLAEAWRRVCNTVPVSVVNSCKLWPAVTAFSFAFVPFEYRSIFGGVIAVGWQTYLSFLNARAERTELLRQREEKEKEKEKEREGKVVRLQKPGAATATATATVTSMTAAV